jgi:hypothetical protein
MPRQASPALLRRAKEMNMEFIYMKQPSKLPAFNVAPTDFAELSQCV